MIIAKCFSTVHMSCTATFCRELRGVYSLHCARMGAHLHYINDNSDLVGKSEHQIPISIDSPVPPLHCPSTPTGPLPHHPLPRQFLLTFLFTHGWGAIKYLDVPPFCTGPSPYLVPCQLCWHFCPSTAGEPLKNPVCLGCSTPIRVLSMSC